MLRLVATELHSEYETLAGSCRMYKAALTPSGATSSSDDIKDEHKTNAALSAAAAPFVPTAAAATTTKGACRFFLKGQCAAGAACQFAHEKSSQQCEYFAAGNCKAGANCPFAHPAGAADVAMGDGTATAPLQTSVSPPPGSRARSRSHSPCFYRVFVGHGGSVDASGIW